MSSDSQPEEICERIRLALLAHREGEPSDIPAADCQQHLTDCSACSRAQQEDDDLGRLLACQTRRQPDADFWQDLEPRLAALAPVDPARARVALAVGGTLLLIYKAYALAPDLPMGVIGRCFPVVLTAMFFAYLRENPLRILTERTFPGGR